MMSSDRDKEQRLDELVLLLREDNLSENEAQELRTILDTHPPAMNRLAEHMVMASSLKTLLEHSKYEQQPPMQQIQFVGPQRWYLTAALVASLMSIFVFTFAHFSGQHDVSEPIAENSVNKFPDDAVAMITRSREAVWSVQADLRVGAQLVPGRYQLVSGVTQIEFFGGAAVMLKGPSEIEIISNNRANLHRGILTATVPRLASGFTIIAGDFEIVDLGTAFGVEAGKEGVEVHVLDGTVLVQDLKNKAEKKQLVHAGEAVKARSSAITHIPYQQQKFSIEAVDIDEKNRELDAKQFERWNIVAERLRKSPDTVLYFDFQNYDPYQRTVHHVTEHATPDGIAVGCTPTQGRWHGKNALQFSSPGDRIRINMPGQYESLTVFMSMRFDGFPQSGGLTSLFFCNADTDNRFHWQFWRNGRIGLGIRGHPHYTTAQPGFDPNVIGRWRQIAVVYDSQQKQVRHYVDGQLIEAMPTQASTPLTVGFAEIGNWNWRSATSLKQRRQVDSESRAFYGAIDEFAIVKRVLNDSELLEMFNAGRSVSP